MKSIDIMKIKNINKWTALLVVLTIVTSTACTSQKKSGEQTDEQATEQTEVTQDELEALAAALPKYNLVCSFHEGLAAVSDKETTLWGFIDRNGQEVIPCQYQYISEEFNEGVAIVCTKDEKLMIIDHEGKTIAPFEYIYRGDGFHDGLITVVEVNEIEDDEIDWQHWGKAGFMDPKGKMVIPADTYDVMMGEGPIINNFSDGLCRLKKDDKTVFIDKTGKVVITCNNSDAAHDFSEGLAAVWSFDDESGKCLIGFIDKTGKQIIPQKYTTVGRFSEGLCWANVGDKFGFIDKTGKWVIEGSYQTIHLYEDTEAEEDLCPYFSEGLAWVCDGDGMFGYIDKTGKTVVPFRYAPGYSEEGGWYEQQPCFDFKSGIARVWDTDSNKYGFIDKEGNEVFPCQFDRAEDMSEGLAVVCRDDQFGFIDAKGNCTLDLAK